MRGRKPKPTRLKLIEGNRGKRPLNPREPRPQPKVPTCPAHLCPAAKAEWKRLARELFLLGIVMDLDRAALAAYSQAYGRWAEAERKLKDTPVLIKLPSGYIQPSPWLGIAACQPCPTARRLGPEAASGRKEWDESRGCGRTGPA